MNDPNRWLIALAFLLGLLLTFALMIRRVTREIPVNGAVDGADAPTTRIRTGGEEATTRIPTARGDDTTPAKRPAPSEAETTKMPVADESKKPKRQQGD